MRKTFARREHDGKEGVLKGLYQFFVILLFYALGELASRLIGYFVPGSVMGMFFLFLALKGGVLKPRHVDGAARFLTDNMGLFFIPAGVGLITQWEILKSYWHMILLSMVFSTIIVMAVVAWSQQHLENRAAAIAKKKDNPQDSGSKKCDEGTTD